MARSAWKPFVLHNIILKGVKSRFVKKGNIVKKAPRKRGERIKRKRIPLYKKVRDSIIPLGFTGSVKIYRGTVWTIKYDKKTAAKSIFNRQYLGHRLGEFSFTKRYGSMTHRLNRVTVKNFQKKERLASKKNARDNKKISKQERGKLKAKMKLKKTAKIKLKKSGR